MDKKGIFELFFVIIMLVLIYPVTTQPKFTFTPNVIAQTDNLSLLVDYAITDAVFDKVYTTKSVGGYDSKVNTYTQNLLNNFNETQGVKCNLGYLNATPYAADYEGSIDITCMSLDSKVVKTLKFKKGINLVHDSNHDTCKERWIVTVIDRYEPTISLLNPTAYQNISNCQPQIIQ